MQYTKSMIDLVFQIRKVAPEELRPKIKLTNPDLMDFLADIYNKFEEFKLKNLIKQLFSLAGPAWLGLITESRSSERKSGGFKFAKSTDAKQMYRGQTVLSEKSPAAEGKKAKVVTYRGQQITVA